MAYELRIDQPLTNPKDDILGRVRFSQEIANSIIKLNVQGGFVYGLYGAWGTGKSTVINFIGSQIETYNNQNQSKNRVIVFRFSPWMISSAEHLVSSFLQQLRVRLGMPDASKFFNNLSSMLGMFEGALELVRPIVSFIPIPAASDAFQIAQQAVSGARKHSKDVANYLEKDLYHIKDDIIKELNQQNNKILIIIDDLDRLHADEIREIFRLIKGVCDFPKMIYLIACDHEKVSKAIRNNQEDTSYGYEYLEKIIQCPIHIPPIDKQKLYKQFFRYFELIIPSSKNEKFYERTDLSCIAHVLKTMRDSTRLLNSFASCYPLVKGEVNISDYITIQAIKVFFPSTYEAIQNNKAMFIFSKYEQDELKQRRREFLAELGKDIPKKLLEIIFPAFGTSDTNWVPPVHQDSYLDWVRCRRLSTEEYFDMYFTLSLADNNFSMTERRLVIALSEDTEKLKEKFRELEQQSVGEEENRFGVFLSDMSVCVKDIPSEYILNFLQALCDISDEIKECESFCFTHMLMESISLDIIDRIEPNKRLGILTNLLKESKSISLIIGIIDDYLKNNQNISENNNEIDNLKSISANEMKTLASKKILKNNPHLSYLLCKWLDWGNPREVKEYIRMQLIKEDDSLINFIGGFTIHRFQGDHKIECKISEDHLKKFLDDNEILFCIQRCKEILSKKGNLNNQQEGVLIACIDMINNKNNTL